MNRLARRTYSILLGLLLLVLIASPVISAMGRHPNLVELFLFASLLTAALGTSTAEQRPWLLAILVGAAGAAFFGRLQSIEAASAAAAIVWISVAVVAAFRAYRFALSGGEIDSEHICAALSVYMLAGHFFGLAYWRLEQMAPGSFAMGGQVLSAGQFDLPSGIYFSFVVIATLGFGDIVPVTTVSRGLVIVEAVLGQFYMVVLVARLVSLYAQRGRPKS